MIREQKNKHCPKSLAIMLALLVALCFALPVSAAGVPEWASDADVTVSNVTETSFDLGWTPADGAESYRVVVSNSMGGVKTIALDTTVSGAASCPVSGLTANRCYDIMVTASNASGDSLTSLTNFMVTSSTLGTFELVSTPGGSYNSRYQFQPQATKDAGRSGIYETVWVYDNMLSRATTSFEWYMQGGFNGGLTVIKTNAYAFRLFNLTDGNEIALNYGTDAEWPSSFKSSPTIGDFTITDSFLLPMSSRFFTFRLNIAQYLEPGKDYAITIGPEFNTGGRVTPTSLTKVNRFEFSTIPVYVNTNPTAADDTMMIDQNSSNNFIDVLSNDTYSPDPPEVLSVIAVSAPAHGTANFTASGVTYTPETDYIGTDSFTYTISDNNGGTATAAVSLKVVAPPAVAITPATQTVQYSDSIQPITITATDLDSAGESLAITTSALPAGLSMQQITEDSVQGIPGTAVWNITGNAAATAGTYKVTVTVSDGDTTGSAQFTIVVAQEDAVLMYTGDTAAPVNGTINLRAQVWDSSAAGYTGINPETGADTLLGDISLMRVKFVIKDTSTNKTVKTLYAPVEDTTPQGDGIGLASVTYTYSSEAVLSVTASLVAVTSSGSNKYYNAASDADIPVAVYINSGEFVTGGGWIADQGDEGNGKGNFGFVARYSKSKAQENSQGNTKENVQGNLVYTYQGMYNGEKAIFKIKSNSLSRLAILDTAGDFGPYPITAILEGKATVKIATANDEGDNSGLYGDGNAAFTVKVIDTGSNSGGGADKFEITVYDKNGLLFKSIPLTLLEGGNVVAHLE